LQIEGDRQTNRQETDRQRDRLRYKALKEAQTLKETSRKEKCKIETDGQDSNPKPLD